MVLITVGNRFIVARMAVRERVEQPLFVASTYKVVSLERYDVLYEFPVVNAVPPVAALYQLTVPADGVAFNVTEPVPHCVIPVELVIVGVAFTTTLVDDDAEQPLVVIAVKEYDPAIAVVAFRRIGFWLLLV